MLLVEPLFGNAVHVWLQPIPAVLSSHLFLYITPEEKDYLAAMRNEHRQKEWLAARALLRARQRQRRTDEPTPKRKGRRRRSR